MTTATAPPTRSPPTPPKRAPLPNGAVKFGPIPKGNGHRVVLYGPGGAGKTCLALTAPGPIGFFDLDKSLPTLRPQLPSTILANVRCVEANDWQSTRDALHAPGWNEVRTTIIDTGTRAEELGVAWTLANIRGDKGLCRRIEDYGYGKGYQHVYDTFVPLLADLDQHAMAGRNAILICHDITAMVPNPQGDDYLRYEPRLQASTSNSSGRANIRLRVREWADHLLFLNYDIDVQDNRRKMSGSRTLYPTEQSFCMAKSRTLADAVPIAPFDPTFWTRLFGQETN